MTKTPRGIRTDGQATRSRILEAAGELFAATGYAETTSKAIAARADVDLASINYHFGNRSGLYQAVLTEAHQQIVDHGELQQLADSELSPSAMLKVFIGQLVDRALCDRQSWHLRVLSRELLSPSSHLQVLVQDVLRPKLAVVTHILSEITGISERDPALMRCLVSVAAPCLMLIVGGRGVPGPLQEIRKMSRDTVVEHLYQFALGGLEAIKKMPVSGQVG